MTGCQRSYLDVDIPEQVVDFSTVLSRVEFALEHLNKNDKFSSPSFQYLPADVFDAASCAKHQIQALMDLEELNSEDEDALDDGFFVCDLKVVFQKLVAWRQLFPRIKPFFALKCNPDPMVAAILGATTSIAKDEATSEVTTAAGFDCASIPEIELALLQKHRQGSLDNCITKRSNVVYANPQRAEKDLEIALTTYKIRLLTFDGPEEIYKIHRTYQQHLAKEMNGNEKNKNNELPQLVLRILVPDEHSSVPLGEKFGVPPDNIPSLVELAVQLKLPIVGVSFHCGSGNHDPNSYAQAIVLAHTALQVIDEIQNPDGVPPCWLLDIGGGYPGCDGIGASRGRFCGVAQQQPLNKEEESKDIDAEIETASKIASVVSPLIDRLFPQSESSLLGPGHPSRHAIDIISEPGRYFVEEAFSLCSRIYRIEIEYENGSSQSGNAIWRHYYIAQGVQGVFKDVLLCGEKFTPIPLRMMGGHGQKEGTNELIPSTVHGPSGEEYDIICPNHPLPELHVGDWLVFDRMGAYTLSIAARSGRPTIRYVVGGTN